MKNKFKEQKWYPYTIAACIAVVLYVVLMHIGPIMSGLGTFLGYFRTVFLGLVIAYIINPLARYLYNKPFVRIKKDKLRWTVSVALAFIIILFAVLFLLGTLIPQLVDSLATFYNNMDGYAESLRQLTDKMGLTEKLRIDELFSISGDLFGKIQSFLTKNMSSIINAGAAAGRGIATWAIALILSVYMLTNKEGLKAWSLRLMRAIFPDKKLETVLKFLSRCDTILVRYIVFSLIDSLIVGVATAIFMSIVGMDYIGLVAMIAAITNLIPTFGPIIGCVIAGLILLLVAPIHALIYVIFSLLLQFVDGYILKPKLFGNSLGVSGLLILVSVIVLGSMFGVLGMLLSIPVAAILDFVYTDALLPWLESRGKVKEKANG